MYYVYALKSVKHNRIYVGLTTKLSVRIKEHNTGKTKSTRFYRPWILIYSEKKNTRQDAREREKELKSGFGKEFLKDIIKAPVAQMDRAVAS